MEEGSVCPKCGEGKLVKPKVFYRVFEKIKHPDFICDHCGAPSWKLPEIELATPFFKKKKRNRRRRRSNRWWYRNRANNKVWPAEKSRK